MQDLCRLLDFFLKGGGSHLKSVSSVSQSDSVYTPSCVNVVCLVFGQGDCEILSSEKKPVRRESFTSTVLIEDN